MPTLNLSRNRKLNGNDDSVRVITEAHSGWSKGWVARVTLAAPGSRYELDREWLRPSATSLSRAGNGTKTYDDLEDGVYEADSVWRSYQSHRTYFHVRDGQLSEDDVTEDREQAKKWLADSGSRIHLERQLADARSRVAELEAQLAALPTEEV